VQAHGPVSDGKLLKYIFLQVCQGLKSLHTSTLKCHLDLKLENILVSEEGVLKLCDFGMVQPIEQDLQKRQGTQMYMAPEIEDKRFDETYRGVPADIFALGVLLWLLRFAAPPFAKASLYDKNYSVLQRNADAFWRLHPSLKRQSAVIDEDLQELLTSMLSSDVSKRPNSVEAVMQHRFFTKEAELIDPSTNLWQDSDALKASFTEKLFNCLASKRHEED